MDRCCSNRYSMLLYSNKTLEKIYRLMKEKFLTYPNLPENKVTLAAVGNYPEIITALGNEGIRTISFSHDSLPDETKNHADMLLCHTGKNRIFTVPGIDSKALLKEGFELFTSEEIGNSYPNDVKLNVAVGKGFYICNPKTIDSNLSNTLKEAGLDRTEVNQGYTKCSVCFVANKAVITEDPSIYKALRKTEADVLLISQGDIYLSEKHSGFFGGSSGKISKDTLAVSGELKYHKDGDRIINFCHAHNVKIKELRKGRIVDIGSILPLLETR